MAPPFPYPLIGYMDTLKIATWNINVLMSPTRIAMMEAFVRLHELDILVRQEVTHPIITEIHGYNVYYNIGTNRRDTALLTRDTFTITNVTMPPSGRAIAANFRTLSIINIYAPSGTTKRLERETFFNNDLTYLLRTVSDNMLVGGDFNCVLETTESTGHGTFSRSLATLFQGYSLNVAWYVHPTYKAHTHYTTHDATRLDRI
jgi:exonuclease III